MRTDLHQQATSFGAAADVYARSRPDYPRDAIDWLVGGAPGRVLDLGAGTGKLTTALVAAGAEVVAVEPLEPMRAQLVGTAPGVEVLAGSAETIPLADASVDAVLAGQAYHWFELGAAVPEIWRVLRPGGVFGAIWNLRDESVPWVAEFSALLGRTNEGHPVGVADDDLGAVFEPVERADFSYTQRLDLAGLLDLVRSRSYVITMEPADRERLLADVRTLVTGRPELGAAFDLPYVTHAYRARKALRF